MNANENGKMETANSFFTSDTQLIDQVRGGSLSARRQLMERYSPAVREMLAGHPAIDSTTAFDEIWKYVFWSICFTSMVTPVGIEYFLQYAIRRIANSVECTRPRRTIGVGEACAA